MLQTTCLKSAASCATCLHELSRIFAALSLHRSLLLRRPPHAAFQTAQQLRPHRRCLISHSSSNDSEVSAVTKSSSGPTSSPAVAPASSNSQNNSQSNSPNGNTGLAGGAVAAGVALFLATRLLSGGPSIAALEQEAIPLDVALSNGKPTVVEFYANW